MTADLLFREEVAKPKREGSACLEFHENHTLGQNRLPLQGGVEIQILRAVANVAVKGDAQVACGIEESFPLAKDENFGLQLPVELEEVGNFAPDLRWGQVSREQARGVSLLAGDAPFVNHAVAFSLHFEVNGAVVVVEAVASQAELLFEDRFFLRGARQTKVLGVEIEALDGCFSPSVRGKTAFDGGLHHFRLRGREQIFQLVALKNV